MVKSLLVVGLVVAVVGGLVGAERVGCWFERGQRVVVGWGWLIRRGVPAAPIFVVGMVLVVVVAAAPAVLVPGVSPFFVELALALALAFGLLRGVVHPHLGHWACWLMFVISHPDFG